MSDLLRRIVQGTERNVRQIRPICTNPERRSSSGRYRRGSLRREHMAPGAMLLTGPLVLSFEQFAQETLILVLLGHGAIQLFGQIHEIFRSVSASRGKLFGSIGTVHLDYAEIVPFPRKNNTDWKCSIRPRAGTACAVSLCSDRCRSAALLTPAP
jgi:hypothetical protein